MTFRAEPTWDGASAAPAEVYAAAHPARVRAVAAVDGAEPSSTKDLESEVYTARDVHGDDRVKLRRKLARARSSMTETSYRRALELARDSVLLTIEECLEGGQAMDWDPLPRPEFTLASIEAAVAELERAEQQATQESTDREVTEQEPAEQLPAQEPADGEVAEQEPAAQEPADGEVAEREQAAQLAAQEPTDRAVAEQEPAEQERTEPEMKAEAGADQEPAAQAEAGQGEREPSATSRRVG